jgi:hypothetical protein
MIRISSSDRVVFVGHSGSGKTELAKYFLRMQTRVTVIDPKHTFRLDGFKINKSFSFRPWVNQFQNVIRPGRNDDDKLAEFLFSALKKKNNTIYVDELAVMEERFPESTQVLREIALTGRERKVSLWNAIQRPRGVPRVFFTETEVYFMFNLRSDEDRQYLTGFIGNEVREQIPRFQFWYYRGEEDTPRLMTLNLKENVIYNLNRQIDGRKELA